MKIGGFVVKASFAESGHKSRTSNTNFEFFISRFITNALIPENMGGEEQ